MNEGVKKEKIKGREMKRGNEGRKGNGERRERDQEKIK